MNDELPSGWKWGSGEKSPSYYTYNFGTEYYMGGDLAGVDGLGGYTGRVFWDRPNEYHNITIRPVIGFEGDDPVYGYDIITRSFESEEEALEAVPELIEELKNRD
jgi:hypothetical protein